MGESPPPGQNTQAKISAVVIAAGLSRRMGEFKLLLPWAGTTVIAQVVGVLCAAGIDDIVVVTGYRAAEVEAGLEGLRCRMVHNPGYEAGDMLQSWQIGVAALPPDAAGALLCLGDQPQIRTETVASLLAVAGETGWDRPLIPSYVGRGGHPVYLPRSLFAPLQAETETLRDLLHRLGQPAYVPVAAPGVLVDLDTPADYQAAISDRAGGTQNRG